MSEAKAVIDALDRPHPLASTGTAWTLVADTVMGGRSGGTLAREAVLGRTALRLSGRVSLENDGGFLQAALDLSPDGGTVDARGFSGIALEVAGNGERYNVHLRTADVVRPWQSYRASFEATRNWRTVRLPFEVFRPHRIEAPLDLARLRRIGIVAIGRAFAADVAVAAVRFTRPEDPG